jgi:hypothetical protein
MIPFASRPGDIGPLHVVRSVSNIAGDGSDILREHHESLSEDPALSEDVAVGVVGLYRGYAELVAALARLPERGARVRHVGHSVRGLPLFVFEVGPPTAERVTALIGGIHAMEWIGVETGLAVFDRLLADPPRGRRVLYWPVVNPDGYREAEDQLRRGVRRFHRVNARGVDLNRNWPTHWEPRHTRTRLLPMLGDGGAAPRSEPEVDSVCRVLDQEVAQGSTIDVALSLHSFGRKVLTPYGGRWRRIADHEAHQRAGDSILQRLRTRYEVQQSSRWVPGAFAYGMELDHLHDAYGALALLVECSRGGLLWDEPGSWLFPFRWFNPPDPEHVVAELAPALDPFVRGVVD